MKSVSCKKLSNLRPLKRSAKLRDLKRIAIRFQIIRRTIVSCQTSIDSEWQGQEVRDTDWGQHDQASVEQPRIHVSLGLLDRVDGEQERNAQTKLEVAFNDCPQQVEREQTEESSTKKGNCTVKLEEEKIQEGIDAEDVEDDNVNEPHNRHNNTKW